MTNNKDILSKLFNDHETTIESTTDSVIKKQLEAEQLDILNELMSINYED